MRTRWVYTGCDTDDQRRIARHWEQLQPGVESRLNTPGAAEGDLAISVSHDRDSQPEWEVQVVLMLPTAMRTSDARAATVETALDQCVGGLTKQLDRRSKRRSTRGAERRDFGGLIPILQQAHRQSRMNVFAEFLRPLLHPLRRHAARELAIQEIEADSPRGQWEVDDLLDETLLRAWNRFDERPSQVPLDAWLVGVLGQALEAAKEESHESLNREEAAEIRRPVEEEESEDQWVEKPQSMEDLELSDLLPGQPVIQAWEQIDPDHRDLGLNHLLGQLSRAQREALVLSAVHGLEAEEIAAVQHVPPDEAQAAIDSGRAQLEHLIDQDEFWPELDESIERQQGRPSRSVS